MLNIMYAYHVIPNTPSYSKEDAVNLLRNNYMWAIPVLRILHGSSHLIS